nr:hydrogenase maturation protease [Bacteroidota bacterium]
MQILIYGYGNPGREDDGLGNRFVEMAEAWAKSEGLANIQFDSNYQLNIEDAAEIEPKDIVIFVDASTEEIDDFILTEITPSSKVEFSMHSVSASYVVQLCNDIYKKSPKSFLLHLKGYQWEFLEGLSARASENLEKALAFIKPLLLDPEKIIAKPV